MIKTIITEKEEEIIVCDLCGKEETMWADLIRIKMPLRSARETHYHIHRTCICSLIDKNKNIYE